MFFSDGMTTQVEIEEGIYTEISVSLWMTVCVCVRLCVKQRKRELSNKPWKGNPIFSYENTPGAT